MNTDPEGVGRAQFVARTMVVAAIALVPCSAGAAADNDDFSDAILLSGAPPHSPATVNTDDATAETGEPDHDFDSISARSIWYEWTPSLSGPVEFNTFGSVPTDPIPGAQYDTVLAIYTGSAVDALTRIAGSDDVADPGSGNTKQSRVRLIVQGGTKYMIAIDGFSGDSGEAQLNIVDFTATRPDNDDWANAAELIGALPQQNDRSPTSTTKSNIDATLEHDEPEHVTESAFSSSVWYKWTATTSGSIAANTTGSDFDTVLSAYTGSSVDDLTLIAENDDYGATAQSNVEFFANFGTTYYFAVDGFDNEEGEVFLELVWGPDPPPNDDLADAQALASATTVSVNSPSGGATKETSETAHVVGHPPTSSIWYSWTAPGGVGPSVEINTFGSNFDTLLAVYTGTGYANLAQVTSNDDAGGQQSRVRFASTPGTTYLIAVDGKLGAQGAVFLNLLPGPTPPANDDFSAAQNLGQMSFTSTAGNNFGASVEAGEPVHFTGITSDGSIWYRWTANADSDVKVTTSGSDFDTVLAAYSGTSLGSLVQLASNDNAGGLQSQVIFPASLGEEYYIAVAGRAGAEGNVQLAVSAIGSYAQWLENWPALVGEQRRHWADADGDGFSNGIEMLCNLHPGINSRAGGSDGNAANAPVLVITPAVDIRIQFTIDTNFIGVSHNGGLPVAFGGELLEENFASSGLVSPSLIGPKRYEIATNFVADSFRFLRLQVIDLNAGN